MKGLRHSLIVLAATLLAGCTGGSGDGSSQGSVRGRMTDDGLSFAPVQGAIVTAYRVEANGSLTAVSDGVATDANGEYELTVTFEGEAISDLVVQAEGTVDGSAIVSATLTDGGEVTAPPIDGETTVEAEVYVSARASGSWESSSCGTAQLRNRIDANLSADVRASATYQQDVAALAEAIVNGMKARAESLLHASVGMTQSALDALLAAEAQAQAELDAALHAAADTTQEQAAIDAHLEAAIQAYLDAGATLGETAQAVQAQATAQMQAAATVSAAALAELRMEAESFKAEVIGRANEAAMAALGAAQQVQDDLASARATLEVAIQASAGVQADIENAWAAYDAYVRAELRAQVEAMQTGAGNTIDTIQSTVTSARTTLEAAITAAGEDADAIAQAYGSFAASIEASVTGDVTLGQFASAHVEATIQIFLAANLNG